MGKRKRALKKFLRRLPTEDLFGTLEVGGLRKKNKPVHYAVGDETSIRLPQNAWPYEDVSELTHFHTHPTEHKRVGPSYTDVLNGLRAHGERPREQDVGEAVSKRAIYSGNPVNHKVGVWEGEWDPEALDWWARHRLDAEEELGQEHPVPDWVLENMGMHIKRKHIKL